MWQLSDHFDIEKDDFEITITFGIRRFTLIYRPRFRLIYQKFITTKQKNGRGFTASMWETRWFYPKP